MGNVGTQLQNMLGSSMKIDTDAFAKAFQMNMTEDDLKELMTSMTMSATASYDNNLQKLGYVDFANPSQISIYPTDFESKENVVKSWILITAGWKRRKRGTDHHLYRYSRNTDVFRDKYRGYHQLCADCVCGDFPCSIFNYDRGYHLHQCT